MRAAFLALMAIGTLSAINVAPAEARSGGYPVCMRTVYGDDDCSYSNFWQCQSTASGQGTTCFMNPAVAYNTESYDSETYVDEPAPRHRHRRHRDH